MQGCSDSIANAHELLKSSAIEMALYGKVVHAADMGFGSNNLVCVNLTGTESGTLWGNLLGQNTYW